MNYAIIQLQGKQYAVSEGDELTFDRLDSVAGDKVKITDVLFISSDKGTKVGTPTVAGASVTLEIKDHTKGDKIRVAKFKSKSRYRKVYGHRQHLTTAVVSKLVIGK